jgi:hypothetical protein
MKNVSPLSQL